MRVAGALVRPMAGLVGVLGLLTACGDQTASGTVTAPEQTMTSTSPSVLPKSDAPGLVQSPCASIWVAGQKLPKSYSGCGTGGSAKDKGVYCESGQRLFTHGADLYAGRGGLIIQTDGPFRKDPLFQRVFRTCRG